MSDGSPPSAALATLPRASRRRLRELIQGIKARTPELPFNGVLNKLLDPGQFAALVFPGVAESQRARLPGSLQELLLREDFAAQLLEIMPRVEARAKEVLLNVKRKGAAQGDVMDSQTERYLKPQILKEAFARETVRCVHEYLRRAQSDKVRRGTAVAATPLHVAARWNQLSPAALEGLLDAKRGLGVVRRLLSPAWLALAIADALRFREEADRMHPTPSGESAWVDAEEDEESYPALAEAVRRLQGIPFELVAKTGAQLLAPEPHTTMLTRVPPASTSSHVQLVDGGFGEDDNGYRVSVLLVLAASPRAGLQAELRGSGAERLELGAGDALLFRSRTFHGQLTRRPKGDDVWILRYWVQGAAADGW